MIFTETVDAVQCMIVMCQMLALDRPVRKCLVLFVGGKDVSKSTGILRRLALPGPECVSCCDDIHTSVLVATRSVGEFANG